VVFSRCLEGAPKQVEALALGTGASHHTARRLTESDPSVTVLAILDYWSFVMDLHKAQFASLQDCKSTTQAAALRLRQTSNPVGQPFCPGVEKSAADPLKAGGGVMPSHLSVSGVVGRTTGSGIALLQEISKHTRGARSFELGEVNFILILEELNLCIFRRQSLG